MTSKQGARPWLAMDVHWWPTIADSIAKPWPLEAVRMDLRWWTDQQAMGRQSMPSRRKLQQRWGLSEYRTRAAMRDVEAWTKPQRDPKEIPNRSQSNPKQDTQTPDIAEDKTPKGSQRDPKEIPKRSTGAELQTTNNKTKPQEKQHTDPVDDLWAAMLEERKKFLTNSRGLGLTRSRRTRLSTLLKSNTAEDVLAVVRWWRTSTHSTAAGLRKDGYDLDTLIRAANFDRYMLFAYASQAAQARATPKRVPRQPKAASGQQGPKLSDYTPAQIQWAERELEPLRGTMKPETWQNALATLIFQEQDKGKVDRLNGAELQKSRG